MSFQIPDDDDDIEMEELEGLIHVNPFAENKQRHLAQQSKQSSNMTSIRSKYKGHSTFLGSYRNKSNVIKMIAFVVILLLFVIDFTGKGNNKDDSSSITKDNDNDNVDVKVSNSIVDNQSETIMIDEPQKEKEDEIITTPETNDNVEETAEEDKKR